MTNQHRTSLKKDRVYWLFFLGRNTLVAWYTQGWEIVFTQMKTRQNFIFILSTVISENE